MQKKNDRAAWLQGPTAVCCAAPSTAPGSRRPLRLVLLGAPGVGKGTQAELLQARLGACQLSTGDIFRNAKSTPPGQRSPALNNALDAMRKGELVTDETVLAMVRERAGCLRCSGGFLLDGFPRTVAQAEALTNLLAENRVRLDAAISYELPLDTIIARLSGRRTCEACKAVFHTQTKPPRQEGVCDACGGRLLQREDDRPESVAVRMQAYATSTAPLTDYYRSQSLLVIVEAEGTPDAIYDRTLAALNLRPSAQN